MPTATRPPAGGMTRHFQLQWRPFVGAMLLPLLAAAGAFVLFGLFMLTRHVSPLALYGLMFKGAFGSWFSWQNTLTRAAPLMLTALCTALPARVGLVVIGGEGALVLGGLGAAAVSLAVASLPLWLALLLMCLAGMVVGGAWMALVGAMRAWRGVNETISSLLLNYIAIAIFSQVVEGVLRDPASLNKPSTRPLPDERMLGTMFGSDIHWGLGFGVIACLLCAVLMNASTFGFAARMVGGNVRAAQLAGLPIARLIVLTCALGGAAAGLAGSVEVAAVQGCANASLAAGYGYTGILVAFLARQQPLAIVPVATVFGGLLASGGLLQRRLHVPDATVAVLEGILFLCILASDTLIGRWKVFEASGAPASPAAPARLAALGPAAHPTSAAPPRSGIPADAPAGPAAAPATAPSAGETASS